MKYFIEPRYRNCVEGYGFLPSARKLGDKYGKKLMDTAIKTGIKKMQIIFLKGYFKK